MQPAAWIGLAALVAQIALTVRSIARMLATSRGVRVTASDDAPDRCVSAIVPVLDEARRIAACLKSLRSQGPALAEIVVVDGGSRDATCEIVRAAAARDDRLRLVAAPPAPDGWNGKAWNLETGLREVRTASTFVVTIDADVRVAPRLVSSLVAHARTTKLAAFSIATRQRVEDALGSALHPSLLTTLVYRFGIPGTATASPRWVQANGQCFFAERDVLVGARAIAKARDSRCEDVTMARALAASGVRFGFFEAGDLAETTMYSDWRELLENWPRSLAMLDRYCGIEGWIGLLQVAVVQAFPLWLLAALLIARDATPLTRAAVELQCALVAMRVGVLCGTRRAYARVASTYWLSPLLDVVAIAAVVAGALRRRHVWRGRLLVRQAAR